MTKSAKLLLLSVVGVAGIAFVGCSGLSKARLAFRSWARDEPDFDALEEHRAAQRTPQVADATRTASEPEPAAPYWTDYRGPGRLGEYSESLLAWDWPKDGPPLLWRQPVGASYSSVVVAHGLAFTMEQRRAGEAVAAYDVETGREVWVHSWDYRFYESLSKEGPRGTPVLAGERLFAMGAGGDLWCLDSRTGEVLWQRGVLADAEAENLFYGLAATPLVVGDRLIVLSGEPDANGAGALAYALDSGEPLWRSLPEKMAYASPVRATLLGRDQVLILTASRLVGIDPSDGVELWSFPWEVSNELTCTQPVVVAEDRVLLSSGYGKGAALVVLESEGGAVSARREWRSGRFKMRFNEPVRRDGHVYGLDEGVLACLDLATGERVWRGERYGYGQLLLAGDRLLILGDEGDVIAVAATPEAFTELARFHAIDGLTMNVPALADGRLFVRNDRELACFDLRPAAQ